MRGSAGHNAGQRFAMDRPPLRIFKFDSRTLNTRTTWTCAAIAGLLFVFIYFVEHPIRVQTNAALSTKVFPSFDTNEATHLEVRRARREVRAIRTGNTWALTSPIEYPAAAGQIETLLSTLANLRWQTRLSAEELKDRPKAQEEFGFTSGNGSIVVKNGKIIVANLLIGTNTPIGDQIYLQVVGDPGVYVVDAELVKSLPRTPNDWRDRTLFHLNQPVNSIKARAGNKVLALQRTNNLWRMTMPLQARADNVRLEELLDKTANLQVTAFETDEPPSDLEPYGLQTPELEVSLAADTNVLATLQVGRSPTNEPAQVFARLLNQNSIFRIQRDVVDHWRNPHTNFVDRHLVNIPSNGIVQIEVRGDDQFSLLRQDNGWILRGATNLVVDPELVRDILNFLGKAEVDIEKEVVADFTAYGLKTPVLQYTLWAPRAPSNSVVAQIDFGTNQVDKIFVRRLDEYPDTVNSMPLGEYNRLPRASWQFRDRRIWSFAPNEVLSVTIEQKGKVRKFVRNAKGDWGFAPGSQGIFNPLSLEESLVRLGDLKAVFWVAYNDTNREHYGFKDAEHRVLVEVKRNGKTELLTLEFGGFSEYGTRYAAIVLNEVRLVFEFPWPLFFEVQDSLTIPHIR